MILSNIITIKWNPSNKNYYISKGYIFTKYNEFFDIKISDLSLNSHIKIHVECDICGNRKYISYQNYLVNYNNCLYYSCSIKCSKKKCENTCIKNYNCENPSQNINIKNKKKETSLKNYGVNNPSQNKDIKEKKKENNLIKYGYEYPIQSKIFKDKREKNCLEKYGVKYTTQVTYIKDKIKESILKKYGYENISQVPEIKNKKMKTSIQRYGFEHTLQVPEIRKRINNTCLEKYGFVCASKNDDVKDKMLKTYLERYGELWIKHIPSYNKNSIIYLDMISERINLPIQHALNGGEKKFERYWVDGFIEKYNIVIEWDEKLHNNKKEKDLIREKYIIDNFGCTIFRIKENDFLLNIENNLEIICYKINEYILSL